MTDLATTHDELRPLMFSIAYRMLGSVSDAEDVVQEAFLRLHKSALDGTVVESPDAFATTVTTRLAIDASWPGWLAAAVVSAAGSTSPGPTGSRPLGCSMPTACCSA